MVEEQIPNEEQALPEPEIISTQNSKGSFVKIRMDHDGFFKASFSDIKLVESFTRENLPEEIVSELDFSTLESSKDTFVDKKLARCFSDILYHIKFKDKERTAILYFLFEHKSWEPEFVHLQLLKNMVNIWDSHILKNKGNEENKENKENKSTKTLPLIIPLLIYHGKDSWESDKSFISMFDAPDAMKRYIPNFDMILFDLPRMTAESIKGSSEVRLVMMALRYSFEREIASRFGNVFVIFNEFKDQATIDRYFNMLMNYYGTTIVDLKPEQIMEVIDTVWKEGGTMSKTLFEILEERGKEIGAEENRKETIANCLALGMNPGEIARIVKLSVEKIEAIRDAIFKGPFVPQS
jgi:predicted transposase YdaD